MDVICGNIQRFSTNRLTRTEPETWASSSAAVRARIRATLSLVLRGVEPFVLTVGDEAIPLEDGLRVDRRGDPLWNGLLLGMTTGAVLGASIDRTGCFHGATLPCVLGPAAIFGALGAWFDHSRHGRTTVFVATRPTVHITPIVTPAGSALSVRVSF